MHQVLEGIYKKGSIKLNKKPSLKENSHLKIWIMEQDEEEEKDIKFGSYKFPVNIDNMNLRDFAHED